MASFEFNYLPRGGVGLCVNSCIFIKGRGSVGNCSYYYCKSKCKSSIQVWNQHLPDLSTLREAHNHPNHEDEIQIHKIVQRIRNRAMEQPLTTMHEIYRNELQEVRLNYGLDVAIRVPSFMSLHSTLYRDRNMRFPGVPKNLTEVNLCGKWASTLQGQQFVLAHDTSSHILILGTVDFLKIACDSDRLVLDGTFRVVPSIYSQLYILHTKYIGQNFPLLYCFLPAKTKQCYIRMLELLKQKALGNGFAFKSKTFNIDFEASAISALEYSFPSSKIEGCLFHFSQCVWRKVQALGFAPQYNSHKDVRNWVRLGVSLALVPLNRLDEAYLLFEGLSPIQISQGQTTGFLDYLVETWVDEADGKFARELRNHFDNSSCRTTNTAESFHSKLNRMAGKPHLNIFAIVELLQRIQDESEIEVERLKTGLPTKLQLLKYRKLNTRIANLKNMLNSNTISLLEYMKSISHVFHLE